LLKIVRNILGEENYPHNDNKNWTKMWQTIL
jgi:hypothetical protein